MKAKKREFVKEVVKEVVIRFPAIPFNGINVITSESSQAECCEAFVCEGVMCSACGFDKRNLPYFKKWIKRLKVVKNG